MTRYQYYLAPMEGITNATFRRTYHAHFKSMDKYFTPFLCPHTKRDLTTKEKKEILPENNEGMYVVPQILTNQAEGFLETAGKLEQYGYREINLNLGCPSKTVITKGRGSGFLAFPAELREFLDKIFSKTNLKVSIKTRIGRDDTLLWEELLSIYSEFPLEELIIHPRIQKEFYKGTPHIEAYEAAYRIKNCPICYNGDMFCKEEIENFWKRFPNTDAMMLGRGILRAPCLYEKLFESEEMDASVWKQKVRSFHDALLDAYIEEMSGDRNVLFKMKELWFYLWESFDGSKQLIKKLKKSGSVSEYLRVVEEIFMQD
ncbi:tRNA-dihydrouridine synthase [Mediterraneibacter butyricigenes]|uniref:tRNA-dihydrouridine synthase n=1 Tax=Mediterraneibacter butyricigenes TaxID=2316025 RepID=A0A391P7D0_9FIRM|nr:tRNA-dihydrouridine synthase family protein [Mediterraneibacter butyricigenes]GCA65569.1 tRNA-dihydrouridine synthase [Mediterraneibacter butyricigenes]